MRDAAVARMPGLTFAGRRAPREGDPQWEQLASPVIKTADADISFSQVVFILLFGDGLLKPDRTFSYEARPLDDWIECRQQC